MKKKAVSILSRERADKRSKPNLETGLVGSRLCSKVYKEGASFRHKEKQSPPKKKRKEENSAQNSQDRSCTDAAGPSPQSEAKPGDTAAPNSVSDTALPLAVNGEQDCCFPNAHAP